MIRVWIFSLLFLSSLAAQTAIDTEPKPDIVDNNHFLSETNKQKTYKITDLKKDMPVAVVIKQPSSTQDSKTVTLTIKSGSQKKECVFQNVKNLCVLEKAPEESGTLDIQCSGLPCEVSWTIYQIPAAKLESSKTLGELYKVDDGAKHMHIALTCPNLEVKEPEKLALVFSNLKTKTVVIGKSLYIWADEVIPGYMLFKKNPEFKSCLEMTVVKIGDKISNQLESDLIKKNSKQVYPLLSVPTGVFRFDLQFTVVPKQGVEKSHSTISVTGQKSGARSTIRSSVIEFPYSAVSWSFNFAIPTIDTSIWNNVQLEIQTSDEYLLVDFQMDNSDHILMQALERSYFDLKKGEKLPVRLVKEEHAEKGDKINIWLSDKNKLSSTKDSCDLGPECDFEIEAKDDINGNLYLGNNNGQSKEIVIYDFKEDMKVVRKVRELEDTYIKKKVQLKKALQVSVNTGNVIVYMATSKKECGLPSQACHDAIGNIHKSFIFTPENEEDKEVIFLIHALDSCQFTLSLIEESTQFIELEDSVPFAYEFDSEEEELKLRFKREKKVDVSFNVIAPVHSVDLVVVNKDKLPKNIEGAETSLEGYLSFPAKETKNDDFTILVRKKQNYKDKYLHFTIVASTTGKQVRLETGITHYETLPKEGRSNAEYIFEFNKDSDFVMNFFTYNTKTEDINIQMVISAVFEKKEKELTDEEKKKRVKSFTIDKQSDSLDLSQVSDDLCTQEGEEDTNCEIFIFLQNKMEMEIDIALTLMSRHSVIELKDGVWQSFDLNSIAKTAHFYFYPRNMNDDISLLYKTDDQSMRLKYRMFYGDSEQIDPTHWPFPSEKINEVESTHTKFKPINHMSISKNEFSNCWPFCIVLISMIEVQKSEKVGSFSVMASNSIMEIPEKEKIDVTIGAEGEKAYLVDLKYALEKEKDVFFNIFHSLGLVDIFANVYSEKNDRIPEEDESDFRILGHDETKIPLEKIKAIIEEQEMDTHNNIYLYLLVQAVTDSKISIEFEFNDPESDAVKMISFDTFEHLKLPPKSSRIYYTSIEEPFEIKIQRSNGFPFYTSSVCKKKLDECIDSFKDDSEKGTQIINKIASYSEKPCEDCYQIFKVSTQEDPSEVVIHLQSAAAEIELPESKPIYDFTEKDEINRYTVYALRDEETFINIDISEGEVDVMVTDFNKVKINQSGSKLIAISIPPEEKAAEKDPKKMKLESVLSKDQLQQVKERKFDQLPEEKRNKIKQLFEVAKSHTKSTMSAFTLSSTFVAYHIEVKSKSSSPSIYTISYSSGDREFDLQDGLITKYTLATDKQSVFYYTTKTPGHAYFSVSMEKSSYLKDLDVVIKFCEPKEGGLIDEDCWTEYPVSKPPVKDKTPNPTIMYSLPAKNYFAIFMDYHGSHEQSVSMGINHQEIMILPYDKEYPFILHQNENVNFLVEISNPGYISMVVRKCDESSPTFSYTYDYDGFQSGDYTYETELSENPKSNFFSKVKEGTLYMHLESPGSQSLLSVLVHYSEKKLKDEDMKAGNNGDMTYSIIDSSSAEVTIHPPVCSKSQCSNKIKYTVMTTSKMRDLFTQLVCPSNFFANYETVSIDPIKEQAVTPKSNSDGTLSFTFNIVDQISYVGLKISDGKTEIYYRPIEVATLWGQISRTSHSHKLAISTVFICSLLGVIVMVRRNARKGYKPIEDQI